MMSNFKIKYLKYKNKYLQLKNQFGGADEYTEITKADGSTISVPSSFIDKTFTNELFLEPVVAADGFTYEKVNIDKWLTTSDILPKTSTPLKNNTLIPNNTLKRAIHEMVDDRAKFPKNFLCPITGKLYIDPVITADGETYEREAITGLFSTGNNTSPYTRLELDNIQLLSNQTIKNAIEEIRIETNKKGKQTSVKDDDNYEYSGYNWYGMNEEGFFKDGFNKEGLFKPLKCVATLEGHNRFVTSVAFHPTEPFMATGSWDNTVKLWRLSSDYSSTVCVATIERVVDSDLELKEFVGIVASVSFHPTDSHLLATCGNDCNAKLWQLSSDYSSATCVVTLEGHTGGVTSVAFHPTDSHLLATSSMDETTKLWQLSSNNQSAKCVATLDGKGGFVYSVVFHAKGTLLATCNYNNTAMLWRLSPDNLSAMRVVTLEGHNNPVHSVAFHPIEPLIATGSSDNTAKLWQLLPGSESVTCVATLTGHVSCVTSVAFHPTAPLLVTSSYDANVKLWQLPLDKKSAKCVATLTDGNVVDIIVFHATMPILATNSRKNVKLWM
jgi:WD40 repeat protein